MNYVTIEGTVSVFDCRVRHAAHANWTGKDGNPMAKTGSDVDSVLAMSLMLEI